MIHFTKFLVRSLNIDFRELSWEIADTQENLLDYTFQVFRSESVSGPWEAISVPFSDSFYFVDRKGPSFHAARSLQYRVRAVHLPTGTWAETDATDVQPEADLITMEVRRHLRILMREFVGRRTWILPVRTFGQRCVCWNPSLSKRTREACPTCFNTGFVRGFMAPIEAWIQFDTGGNLSEQTTTVSPQQQMNTTARLPYFGPIKPRDVLIEAENKRWRVVSVNQTEHVRSPVHYELTLHQIPAGDIEYKYKVPLQESIMDLSISPARNYTNPMQIDAVRGEEVPDFLSLYPTTYTRGELDARSRSW